MQIKASFDLSHFQFYSCAGDRKRNSKNLHLTSTLTWTNFNEVECVNENTKDHTCISLPYKKTNEIYYTFLNKTKQNEKNLENKF